MAPEQFAVGAYEARRPEDAETLGIGSGRAQALLDLIRARSAERRPGRDAEPCQQLLHDGLIADLAAAAELGGKDGAAKILAPAGVEPHMGETRREQARLGKRIGPPERQAQASA